MDKFQYIFPESKMGTTENHNNSRFIELCNISRIHTGHKNMYIKTEHNDETYEALEVIT